jgi:hypothetical protein
MNARITPTPMAPFADCSGQAARKPEIWRPYLVTREAIDAEVERLAALPRPANGRRASRIVHPSASLSMGFTPGTDVSVQVLLPGESTTIARTNRPMWLASCAARTGWPWPLLTLCILNARPARKWAALQ